VNEAPAAPASDREPAPPAQPVRVSQPASVPTLTYSIVGITVAVYLLQLASIYFLGYANAPAQIDWLEYFGAQIDRKSVV